MAATGAGSLAFIDNVTVDSSSRINSEVYSTEAFYLQVQSNASKLIGWCFIPQQGNYTKHAQVLLLKMFQPVCFDKSIV